jgi:hypothetical protein
MSAKATMMTAKKLQAVAVEIAAWTKVLGCVEAKAAIDARMAAEAAAAWRALEEDAPPEVVAVIRKLVGALVGRQLIKPRKI